MEILFKKGLPGLEDYKRYELEDIEGTCEYKLLQSKEIDELGIVLTSPFSVVEEYEIKLTDEIIKNLEISSPEDVALYTTVNLNSDMKKTTTNLRAPIVINITNGLGEQLITENEKYKIKHPIFKG